MVHSDQISNLENLEQPQIKCLAEAIYHEARGESHDGKSGVALVVMNRATIPEFPDTWCKVVYDPGQFEWVRKTKRGHKHSNSNPVWAESYFHAIFFSVQYHMGMEIGPKSVQGASFFSKDGFKNPKLVFSDQIGGHKFYELVN